MIRNYIVWDNFTLSPISLWNLGFYQAPAVLADATGISMDEARMIVPVFRGGNTPGSVMDYLPYLLSHPVSFIKTHITGTAAILVDPFISFWASAGGQEAVSFGFSRLFMQGSVMEGARFLWSVLAGQLSLFSTGGILFSLLYLAWIYFLSAKTCLRWIRSGFSMRIVFYLVLTPGVVGNGRFRIPAEPFLAVMASLSFVQQAWKRGAESDHKG